MSVDTIKGLSWFSNGTDWIVWSYNKGYDYYQALIAVKTYNFLYF